MAVGPLPGAVCALMELRIGTAGWTIPANVRDRIPGNGTHLERYARVMNATEINSSFHRPHRRSTYERWACAVPPNFAFSVKIPKVISHEKRCVNCDNDLARFLDESAGLGEKRQLLLLQLPPSFVFDTNVMKRFFALCRAMDAPHLVCEPRHPSWFTQEADALLATEHVARVAADPARVPRASTPGGWSGRCYFRMHGAPRMYYSSYLDEALAALARSITGIAADTWCIFDNTASGAALGDALRFRTIHAARSGRSP